MADKIIITTDGGSKTIENINPAARHATLAQFGEKIADLTTNTYQKTDRITKVNCDTEPGGGVKPTPTLTLSQSSIAIADMNSISSAPAINPVITITTNSDGRPYIRYTSTGTTNNTLYYVVMFGNEFTPLKGANANTAQKIYVGVTETDSYKGVEVEFNITV